MLEAIVEEKRLAAPSGRPHAVAVDGDRLWISSLATHRVDAMQRSGFEKTGEIDPPGMPWGMTYGAGSLYMTCGETDESYRRIRRYDLARGFLDGFVACPDDAGSHLSFYDGHVLLAQWYNKRLLLLDEAGKILKQWDAPHGVAGVAVRGHDAHLLCTDDEDFGTYWITRLDLRTGVAQDTATVPFHARGLAWGGDLFWTNDRENDQVVTFRVPET